MENKGPMITDESDIGGTHYVLHLADAISNRKVHVIIYAHCKKNWSNEPTLKLTPPITPTSLTGQPFLFFTLD